MADVNESPANLDKVADCWTYESATVNTEACLLSSTDPDIRAEPQTQTHTYSIVSGTDGDVMYAVYNNPSNVALFGSTSPPAGT